MSTDWTNEGAVDRFFRIAVGVVLIAFALFGPGTGYDWLGWIGVVPLITGIIGWCPVYRILGWNTAL